MTDREHLPPEASSRGGGAAGRAGRVGRLAVWVLIAAGLSSAMSWLPAPSGSSLWAGNVSAVYLVLPFIAVAATGSTGSWRSAAMLGVCIDWAMVAGFYARALYDPDVLANNRRGGGDAISWQLVGRWLDYLVLGRTVWLVAGLGCGIAFGLLGRYWLVSGRSWPAVAIALTVALEPVAHLLVRAFGTATAGTWAAEIVAGLALLAGLMVWQHRRTVTVAAPSGHAGG